MTELTNTNLDITSRIQDPQCATENLSAWVGLSLENDRLIAAHKNTGAETLEKLSRSEDERTRELVTGNPNAPVKVLMDLADDFPRAFLRFLLVIIIAEKAVPESMTVLHQAMILPLSPVFGMFL